MQQREQLTKLVYELQESEQQVRIATEQQRDAETELKRYLCESKQVDFLKLDKTKLLRHIRSAA